ncbi:MAG: SDR family oxidoreductase [Candidatus Accumulibacter sp.]|jgi:uncharacterized protein YbjT (DUF2867 family)|nr:SDR family oxidoreductase [Accumulibacter sp.]
MEFFDLLLFGATRNTGFLIARQALAHGEKVAALVRGANGSELESLGVRIVRGDAFNADDCARAILETAPRRVVSTLGGKDREGRRVDAEGNINAIAASERYPNIKRFVLVTSIGSGEQFDGISENARKFLGDALRAKTQAEEALRKSRLPWTIVRPCGLSDGAPTGDYALLDAPDARCGNALSRADVAAAVLEVLDDPRWIGRAVTVQKRPDEKPKT